MFISIGLRRTQFVERGRRKRRQQLKAADVSAIVEIGSGVQRVQASVVGIERILVSEIVIAREELVLRIDVHIDAQIQELDMLYRPCGGKLRSRNSDGRRIGGRDGHRLRGSAQQMLIGAEYEYF